MATTDYIFTFTDSTKTNFVVKPYTFNGHQAPANPALYSNSGLTAVSANTSLVLLGKGMPDYGEAVQNNFIYTIEHFANNVPPLVPIEGQIWYNNAVGNARGLYVYNKVAWDRLLIDTIASGAVANLNMGGFNITNLGGVGIGYGAVNLTDLSGAIGTHAAPGTGLHLSPEQNTLLDGLVLPALTSTDLNHLTGTASNVQIQINSKLSTSGGGMTGNLSMGSNRIVSVSNPIAPDDAATKQYVDSISVSGGADGVVNAGSLDPISGVLTLGRTVGVPVVVSGAFAPSAHTQSDSTVTHDLTSPTNQSLLSTQSSTSTPSVYDTIVYLDQTAYDMQRPRHRELQVATGATTFTLRPDMQYNVNENKLRVYANGVKQYASERGHSIVTCTSPIIGLYSNTGLALSTGYTFNITLNGVGPTPITVTTSATGPYTFRQLVQAIDLALLVATVDVSISVEQFLDRLTIVMVSSTSGNGSSVVVSYGVGSLFQSIATAAAPVNTAITTDYSYKEVGIAGSSSVQLTFHVAPAIGTVMEFLV